MNEKENRIALARVWLDKAQSALSSSQLEYGAGQFAFAVNRLYYAVFYAVSAACAAEGREYGKHTAVRAVFNKEYVATGRVAPELGRLYNQLFDDRQEADYAPLRIFSAEDVEDRIGIVRNFIDAFSMFVK